MAAPAAVPPQALPILPLFGQEATYDPNAPTPPMGGWDARGAIAPLGWAFTRREGMPSVRGMTSEEISTMNKEMIKGLSPIHASSKDALNAINFAHTELTRALSGQPDWLQEGEGDIVKKLSIQRRHSQTWFLPSEPPPLSKPTKLYSDTAAALAKWYHAAYKRSEVGDLSPYELALRDTDPPDTNAGWPLFSNNITDFITIAANLDPKWKHDAKGWPSATQFKQGAEALGIQLGVPGTMFSMGVARRAGPTRKALPLYDLSSGLPVGIGTTTGAYTRSRLVYMSSRLFNMAISPGSQQMKAARLSHWMFAHDAASRKKQLAALADAEARGMTIIESDFSSYDTTFTPEHRSVIYDACLAVGFFGTALELLGDLDANGSFFTPSWGGVNPGEATEIFGRFGLFSGIKETSNLGSFHVQVIVLKAFIATGNLTLDDVAQGRFPLFLNLGDDVLLAAPPSLSAARYQSLAEEEGVIAKLLGGKRMLMRHISGGKEYSVASRIVQQTLANEDSYLHPGHAILGIAARMEIAPYPSLLPAVKNILLSTITGDIKDAIHATKLDRRAMLARPEVADFLESAAGRSWADALLARGDIRPEVAALLSALMEAGGSASIAEALASRRTIVDAFLRSPALTERGALEVVGERITYAF